MSQKRILVVDDDVELCEGIAEMLEDEGYSVRHTSDVFEGRTLIQNEEFDIAILDYKMAGLSGSDLLRELKKIRPKTRILMVSGRPFIDKILKAENLLDVVDGIISKPFKAEMLIAKVRSLAMVETV